MRHRSTLFSAPRFSAARRGSALLIVLAMVVLLTGLIVTFLFRSGSSVFTSSSSANATHAALFGQGALDTILGDLKQEIVAGSAAPSVAAYPVYQPTSNQNAIPAVALPSGVTQAAFPNLVKMSAAGVAFYPNGPTRACSSLTTTASLNGILMSLSNWNKPLLLPKATASNTYDLSPPISAASAPNWILVSRDGSNPTAWDVSGRLKAIPANAALPPSGSPGQPNPVVGRYAYAIYNEGGLLDANVAGSPTATAGTPISKAAAYKNALAYADLTQLTDSSGNQLLTVPDINALVGWRNYASAQATGNFPSSYLFPAQNGTTPTPYDLAILQNPTGFLRTANTALSAGQSDHMFLTRQQLIAFLQAADPGNLANMQNVMQYLGTFSRGLDQPSYAPTAPAPVLLNDGGGASYSSVNPSFLGVQVQSNQAGFTRNDGSIAVAGEPLVKKRFALNRLAWLTYQGPITLDGVSFNPAVPNSIITALENVYGLSSTFLLQGAPANIYKYFGLTWVQAGPSAVVGAGSQWVYSHSSTSPPGAYSAGGNAIMTLSQVLAAGREADFFELLKAADAVGSKAVPGPTTPAYQSQRDNSVDYAVIQLGANIIEQAKLDGYPIQIAFKGTGGTGLTEQFFGSENLPYLYRIRNGDVEAELPNPPNNPPTGNALSDVGAAVVLQQPDIWNPYDANSPRCGVDASGHYLTDNGGAPLYPQYFQIVAYTCAPNQVGSGNYASTWANSYNGGPDSGTSPSTVHQYFTYSPFTSAPLGPLALTGSPNNGINNGFQNYLKMNGKNEGLQFQVPTSTIPGASSSGGTLTGASLFHEPTALITANVPVGSNLQAVSGSWLNQITGDGNGIASKVPTDSNKYLGFFMGVIPITWESAAPTPAVPTPIFTTLGQIDEGTTSSGGTTGAINTYITYCLQYSVGGSSGGPYYAYDQKYMNSEDSSTISVSTTTGIQSTSQLGNERTWLTIDPRTLRFGANEMRNDWFGMGVTYEHNPSLSTLPFVQYNSPTEKWSTSNPNVTPSDRPDYYGGFGADSVPLYGGFFSAASPNWHPNETLQSSYYQAGSLSQNNPNNPQSALLSPPGQRYRGDPLGVSAMPVQNTYFSDADNVVRPAMGAYVGMSTALGSLTGLPMATTLVFGSDSPTTTQSQSRPMMLHRPFRSVAELSYVFSGVPWRNIDFMTPQSGDTALLDVFCIQDTDNPNGMVAGKIDLNTRQVPVLQAILSGAYVDEQSNFATPPTGAIATLGAGGSSLTPTQLKALATALVARTGGAATGKGPLTNIGDLVGRYASGFSGNVFSGGIPYDGYSADLTSILSSKISISNIQRFREAPIRALTACGQTRVWNLMIDLVAQTGRYPASANNLDQFVVDGQRRLWVHLAIDRYTGQVLDEQVETVKD